MNIFKFTISKGDWFKAFAVVVSCALFVSVSFTTAFFWMIFLVFWAFKLDSRVPAGVAIIFLIIIPNLLALEKNVVAENLAVYTFFLLCITVVLQIIELIRERNIEEVEEIKPKKTSPRKAKKTQREVVLAETPEEPEAPMYVLNLRGRRLRPRKLKVNFSSE